MIFQIKWTETAVKSLEKMDRVDAKRVIEKIEEIKCDPFRYVKKLRGVPFYTLRIGKYRVILIIDFQKMTIFIVEVEHRKKVYKKLKR